VSRHWIDNLAMPPAGRVPMGWAHALQTVPVEASMMLAPMPAAWECDLNDDSLRWTAGVYDLFGLEIGSRVDRRAAVEMYGEESRELLERLRSEAIAARGSFTFEAQIFRPNGEMRWMRVTADVACSNGRATHLYGLKQDITGSRVGR
jgi:PAS domain-containing protein